MSLAQKIKKQTLEGENISLYSHHLTKCHLYYYIPYTDLTFQT